MQVDPKTQGELIKAAEAILSGTPKAAENESFSWVILFWFVIVIVAILLMTFAFNRYLIKYLTEFVQGLMQDQVDTHKECHANQMKQLQVVASVVADQKASNEKVVDVNEKVVETLSVVTARLGHP